MYNYILVEVYDQGSCTSGEATKAWVAGLASFLPVKFLL